MAILFVLASSQSINLGLDLPLLNGATACSLMGWLRPTTLPGGIARVLSIGFGPPPGSTTSSRASLGGSGTSINVSVRNLDGDSVSTNNSPTAPLVAGVWQHVGFSYDCNTKLITYYYNGVSQGGNTALNATGTVMSSTNSKSAAIGAGADAATNFTNGDLEDVRVYNRLLSEAEFMSIFSAMGKDGIVFGLQGRWHMRELGEGVSVTNVRDLSNSGISGSPSATPPTYTSGSGSSITSPRSRRVWSA